MQDIQLVSEAVSYNIFRLHIANTCMLSLKLQISICELCMCDVHNLICTTKISHPVPALPKATHSNTSDMDSSS